MCSIDLGPGPGSGDPTRRHLAGPLGTSSNALANARAHDICCSSSCSKLPADVLDARHLYVRYTDRANASHRAGIRARQHFLSELS